MWHADANEVIDLISIEEACAANGIEIRRGNQILCPAHMIRMGKRNTRYGNCLIYKDDNRFKCHSCGAYGNIIDLTMHAQDMNYCDAVDFLAEQCAPYLLKEEKKVKASKKKTCPFSDEDLIMIGIKARGVENNPLMDIPSKWYANDSHSDVEDEWYGVEFNKVMSSAEIQGKSYRGNPDSPFDCLLVETVPFRISDLFEDDPDAFRLIVTGKAIETMDNCKRLWLRIKELFSKGDPLRDALKLELLNRYNAAKSVLEYYKECDRQYA